MSAKATHELLRRYFSGDLTAPEETELERRANQDPVLAEALTGLRQVPEADHTARVGGMLASVRRQAETGATVRKIASRSRRPVYAAVAAVLLLLVTVALWSRLAPREAASELALEESEPFVPPASTDLAPAPEPVPVPKQEPTVTNTAPPEPASGTSTRNLRPRPETAAETEAAELDVVVEETTAGAPPTPPAPLPSPSLTAPKRENNKLEEEIAEAAAAEDQRAQARQRQREKFRRELDAAIDDGSRLLIGRITDANGEPIDRALVRLPGLPLGQRTDTSGIFRMEVDAVASLLEISHPDFEAEKFTLPREDEDLQI
ncbi:MAG: carboxypeptidase-like regulatory domain-containing protein, partial [Bacteroidota bacterium]